ncbi:MAG: hypothetical protein KQA38_03235 [Candidatus Aenigmarchaeota archaeon]|nr:hypothetical protein [Candidatus Aenigmarchaeota archaeon]
MRAVYTIFTISMILVLIYKVFVVTGTPDNQPTGTLSVATLPIDVGGQLQISVTGYDDIDVRWIGWTIQGSGEWHYYECTGIQNSCSHTWTHSFNGPGDYMIRGGVWDNNRGVYTNDILVLVPGLQLNIYDYGGGSLHEYYDGSVWYLANDIWLLARVTYQDSDLVSRVQIYSDSTSSFWLDHNCNNEFICDGSITFKVIKNGNSCRVGILNGGGIYTIPCYFSLGYQGRDTHNEITSRSTSAYVVECIRDFHCGFDPVTHVKQKCDSPQGTDNPQTPGYTYTCWAGPCKTNADCEANYCCTFESISQTGRPGPGETIGQCVSISTVRQPYLCTSG